MRIELRHVHKAFGDRDVLRDIDLHVQSGTRLSLVGPNGSGKSTLLRALMGMLRVDGKVELDGMNPFEHRLDVARRITYVPQIAPRLLASVKEVVATVSTLRNRDPRLVAERASALGLDLPALQPMPFQSLSGGMKQKLLIALAFASGASLYILDEPTASLDATSRARFVELLEQVTGGATVLLCSHRSEEVRRLTERVVELGEGVIVTDQQQQRRQPWAS